MNSVISINRLLKSKKNTINILTDGGRHDGDSYIPGTHYTGYVSINGHAVYRQDEKPETVYIYRHEVKTETGRANSDITERKGYKNILSESEFHKALKFPFDISLDYKGGDKISLYARKSESGEIEVHAYQTMYIKPFVKCKHVYVGKFDTDYRMRKLYVLDDDNNILAVVLPWLLEANSPLKHFIIESAKAWYVGGMEAVPDFESDLVKAMECSKQYYDNKNKERIEKEIAEQEKHDAELKAQEIGKVEKIITDMSIIGAEISGEDIVKAARYMEMELHPRTIGSLRKRIHSITIKETGGFTYSFYKTKKSPKVSNGTLMAIHQIIENAQNTMQ